MNDLHKSNSSLSTSSKVERHLELYIIVAGFALIAAMFSAAIIHFFAS